MHNNHCHRVTPHLKPVIIIIIIIIKSLFRDPLQNSFAIEIWVVTHRLKNAATDVCYKLHKSKVIVVWLVTPFILVGSY